MRQRLVLSGVGVPEGTTTAVELADRIARAGEDLARLSADIDQRRTHLWRLADETAGFVTEQQALARANAMIRDADRHRGIAVPAPADAAGDLADHTSAVLAAYRELTQLPGPASR
jgi:cytosine/adenosine deaminase-related metal-dependent hydrolase